MKLKRRHKILIILPLIVIAYFVVPFPFLLDSAVPRIRQKTILWLFHHNHSAMQDKLEVCFVGIGTTFDPDQEDFWPTDPPKDFVERLSDLPVPVLPMSQNQSKGFGGVFDKTRRQGLVFAAGDTRRWSLGLVVCRGFYYEGGLSSAGYDVYLLRLPFVWIPIWSRMLWIS